MKKSIFMAMSALLAAMPIMPAYAVIQDPVSSDIVGEVKRDGASHEASVSYTVEEGSDGSGTVYVTVDTDDIQEDMDGDFPDDMSLVEERIGGSAGAGASGTAAAEDGEPVIATNKVVTYDAEGKPVYPEGYNPVEYAQSKSSETGGDGMHLPEWSIAGIAGAGCLFAAIAICSAARRKENAAADAQSVHDGAATPAGGDAEENGASGSDKAEPELTEDGEAEDAEVEDAETEDAEAEDAETEDVEAEDADAESGGVEPAGDGGDAEEGTAACEDGSTGEIEDGDADGGADAGADPAADENGDGTDPHADDADADDAGADGGNGSAADDEAVDSGADGAGNGANGNGDATDAAVQEPGSPGEPAGDGAGDDRTA